MLACASIERHLCACADAAAACARLLLAQHLCTDIIRNRESIEETEDPERYLVALSYVALVDCV